MNTKSLRRLLVIAAHPDDEVLGCSATVARFVREGARAHLCLLAGGVAGRVALSETKTPDILTAQKELRKQAERSADIVGYASIKFYDFPDNRMDIVSRADLAQAVRLCIEDVQPQLVLTHHSGDYNWNHGRTFDSVMMAARRNPPEFSPSEVWTFEVFSSSERAWQSPGAAFHPNLYIDVLQTIDVKKQAMLCYQMEYREYPHPRSLEAIEYLARKRGHEVGLQYAEAFHLIRKVVE